MLSSIPSSDYSYLWIIIIFIVIIWIVLDLCFSYLGLFRTGRLGLNIYDEINPVINTVESIAKLPTLVQYNNCIASSIDEDNKKLCEDSLISSVVQDLGPGFESYNECREYCITYGIQKGATPEQITQCQNITCLYCPYGITPEQCLSETSSI